MQIKIKAHLRKIVSPDFILFIVGISGIVLTMLTSLHV